MTVNDPSKIDLYQWLFYLARHARRHLQQPAAIDAEFLEGQQSRWQVAPDAAADQRDMTAADRGREVSPGSGVGSFSGGGTDAAMALPMHDARRLEVEQ